MAVNRALSLALLSCLALVPFNVLVTAEFGDCPTWPAVNVTTQHKYFLYFLVPFENNYHFCRDRVRPAIDRALEDAKARRGSFPYPEIVTVFENSQCNADVVPNVASDIQNKALVEQNCSTDSSASTEIHMFVGPTCDYASGRVASLSNHWDWPNLLTGARAETFDKKVDDTTGLPLDCCATITRPSLTTTDTGTFFANLFDHYEWTNSTIVYSTLNSHGAHVSYNYPSDCATMLTGVSTAFRTKGWPRYSYYNINYRTYDVDIENDSVSILTEIAKSSRVSIWCVSRPTMRRVMLQAREMGMTGGDYAFIYLDFYNTNQSYSWTDEDDSASTLYKYNSTLKEKGENYLNYDPDDQATIEALRALQVLTIRTRQTDEYKNFSAAIQAELRKNQSGPQETMDYVNPFITHYYDTVLLLEAAIKNAFCYGNVSVEDGRNFTVSMRGVTITSLGREVNMKPNGDRLLDYSLFDMNTTTNKFEPALEYFGKNQTFRTLKEIDWPGSAIPLNVPKCGYQDELCPSPIDWVVFSILMPISVVLLLLAICIFFLFRKVQHERYLRKMSWKVRWEDIDWRHRDKVSANGSRQDTHSYASSTGGSVHALGLSGRRLFTKAGVLKGTVVAVKELSRRRVSLDSSLLNELEKLYEIDHEHICKFMGANDEAPHVCILTEYCSRGSLNDVLEDSQYEIEDVFKNSFISDIVNGMLFLHRSFFQLHGNLKSSNCLVDSRFVVKLTDFGLEKFREGTRTDSRTGHKYLENKLWTAPELLRSHVTQGTQKGDVYSFAITAQEILYRKGVFYRPDEMSVQEILHQVTSPVVGSKPLRPTLDDNDDVVVDPELRKLIRKCWAEHQNERPTFQEIHREVRKFQRKMNLVDSLLERLESYSQHLEDKVEERTEQLHAQKERADTLLYQMLPKQVAERLKEGTNVLPTSFEKVTIFFSDIVGFTAISHGSTPLQVVDMLNDLYTKFDTIIDRFDVYKVETIGDAYMVVSGLPNKNENRHAREIARMSLSLINCVKYDFKIKHMPDTQLKLRVGMHSGPVVAGVVGLKMPRYCLFGDTVNTASRMESNGQPLSIHVSPKTKEVLDEFGTFNLQEREEEVFLKGLGHWKTWWLLGENESSDDLPSETSDLLEKQYGNEDKNTIMFVTNESVNGAAAGGGGGHKFGRSKRRGTDAFRERRSGVLGSVIHGATEEGMSKEAIIQEHVRLTGSHDSPKSSSSSSDGQEKPRHVKFDEPSATLTVALAPKDVEAHGRDSGIGMTFDNDGFRSEPSEQSDML